MVGRNRSTSICKLTLKIDPREEKNQDGRGSSKRIPRVITRLDIPTGAGEKSSHPNRKNCLVRLMSTEPLATLTPSFRHFIIRH